MGQPLSKVDSYYQVTADARPSNYLINHVSWSAVPESLNWTKMILVRNVEGFPVNPDDGVTIFTETSDSVVLQVTGVNSSGAINTTPTVVYFAGQGSSNISKKYYTASTTFSNVTGVASVNVDTETISKGTGATFTLATDADANVTVSSYSTTSSGYAVGDLIRISGDQLGSRTNVTSLGITNKYHVFDKGTDNGSNAYGIIARTASGNPGYGVTGTTVTTYSGKSTHQANEPTKYFYSVFVKTSTKASDYSDANRAYNSTRFYWKKLADVSCPIVKDKGTVTTLLNHLPDFYKTKYDGKENTDLKAFLSLFAFHLDCYLASADSVFRLTDIDSADEKSLNEWLTQFGRSSKDVVSVEQLRKLVKNILPMYENNGSTFGLQNIVETYAGWNTQLVGPKNLMPNYNSSSFLESLDSWYATPSNPGGSYASTTPFLTNASLYTPESATFSSYTEYYNDPAYSGTGTKMYGVVASVTATATYPITSATATASTITYTSASHPFLKGQSVIIDNMSALYYNTTGVVTTTTTNTFTIANYNGSITAPFTWVSGGAGTASVSSNGIVLKVSDTSNILQGMHVQAVTGAGVFAQDCYVTAVLDSTTIKLSNMPTEKVSAGDKVAFSTNLNSNCMRIKPDSAGATTASYYMGPKRVKVVSAVSNSRTIEVRPGGVAKIGDYIVDPVGNSIPQGTKVKSINTSTSTLGLVDKNGKASSITLSADTELWLSNVYSEKAGIISAAIAVIPNRPYAFSIKVNPANNTRRDVTTRITWYDQNGNLINSVTSTLTAANQIVNSWNTASVTGASPTNAAYAIPSFDVQAITSADAYYADAAMFSPAVTITSASFDSGTGIATLSTNVPHNFTQSSSVTVTGVSGNPSYGVVYNTTSSITSVSQNHNKKEYLFSYTTTGSAGETSVPQSNGYAASAPAVFEDARKTKLKVLASRVNLMPNPSFEVDTTGWSGGTSVTPPYPFVNTKAYRSTTTTAESGVSYTSTSAPILVDPNSTYSISAYCSMVAGGGSGYVKLKVEWVRADNTIISTTTSSAFSVQPNDIVIYPAISTKEWTKVYLDNQTAPAESYRVNLHIIYSEDTDNYFMIDGVKVENFETSGRYFDGNFDGFTYGPERDSIWEPTEQTVTLSIGKTRSHLYKNRAIGSAIIDKALTNGMYYA